MITVENYLGRIGISEDYLVSLISRTASQCFGVADLNPVDTKKYHLVSLFKKADLKGRRGVKLNADKDGNITVSLHISVLYGTNISAVTENLAHKIRYTVEDKTELKISKISVFIDGMLE
ncbi:MAG: Asp23/Gls24 family envelope stress response protein [Oscillospiraceae bacterium]